LGTVNSGAERIPSEQTTSRMRERTGMIYEQKMDPIAPRLKRNRIAPLSSVREGVGLGCTSEVNDSTSSSRTKRSVSGRHPHHDGPPPAFGDRAAGPRADCVHHRQIRTGVHHASSSRRTIPDRRTIGKSLTIWPTMSLTCESHS
jgi:hypothetical protein